MGGEMNMGEAQGVSLVLRPELSIDELLGKAEPH